MDDMLQGTMCYADMLRGIVNSKIIKKKKIISNIM